MLITAYCFVQCHGRLYCLLYGVSCVTKHSSAFGVLLFGRVVGGVSTSILHSAFESWMVHEHRRAAYPDEWLSETFSVMTFANGLVAIGAGVAANFAANHLGYTAPFDIALCLLVVCAACISSTWTENYGKQGGGGGGGGGGGAEATESNFGVAWRLLRTNRKVACLGCLQACFESAMFIFVFQWTPILEESSPGAQHVPHGLVFASFMVCLMIGSYTFKAIARRGASSSSGNTDRDADADGGGGGAMAVDAFVVRVFYVAAPALLLPVLLPEHHWLGLASFCVFEVCCGAYFPAVGVLRGRHVPSEVRSTVISLFRVPVNLFVVLVLAYVAELSHLAVMAYCGALLAGGAVAARRLRAHAWARAGKGDDDDGGNDGAAAAAVLKKTVYKDAPEILSKAARSDADKELRRAAADNGAVRGDHLHDTEE